MTKEVEPKQQISLIEQDLTQIPTDKPELKIMVGLARRGLNTLGTNFSGDTLFSTGVALAHAKIHAGLIQQVDEIDRGYYAYTGLNSDFDREKKLFAQLAIPAYREGFRTAESAVPKEIKDIVAGFYPFWFEEVLGIPFSAQTLDVIQHPRPMVLPFDHNNGRTFVGEVMRFPSEGNCRFFYNMKGWYLPPTRWVSANPANDSEALVAYKVERGVDRQTALLELGSHEGAHVFSIDPVVEIVKVGPAHSWITEAYAQYYGDGEITMKDRVAQTSESLVPSEIAYKLDGSVDYGAGFLLTQALAAKFAGSIELVPQGMVKIIKRVAEYAELVRNGQAEKAKNSLDLLYIIDPSLRTDESSGEITRIMGELKSDILK